MTGSCFHCVAGDHTISVMYANCPVFGSPFNVDVFDPAAVEFIGQLPECFVLGKPASFKGNILL